jgi:hypothetical protein
MNRPPRLLRLCEVMGYFCKQVRRAAAVLGRMCLEVTPGWKRAFCSGQMPQVMRIFAAHWSISRQVRTRRCLDGDSQTS